MSLSCIVLTHGTLIQAVPGQLKPLAPALVFELVAPASDLTHRQLFWLTLFLVSGWVIPMAFWSYLVPSDSSPCPHCLTELQLWPGSASVPLSVVGMEHILTLSYWHY